MPQITTKVLSFAVLGALALALSGCGDANPKATFDPAAGKHPATWLPAGHAAAAEEDVNGCAECHGDDLNGGIAKVTCFGTEGCHIGNTTSAHPVLWGQVAYALHSGYVAAKGTATCATALCHGTDLAGVADSGPSCTSCHMPGESALTQIHTWGVVAATQVQDVAGHKQYFQDTGVNYSTCRNAACHGATLQGVFLSGPSCIACHTQIGFPVPAEN